MSWRTSAGSTNRWVAQALFVPGISTASTSRSWVTNEVGASIPSTTW
jgi:hypothetical protein